MPTKIDRSKQIDELKAKIADLQREETEEKEGEVRTALGNVQSVLTTLEKATNGETANAIFAKVAREFPFLVAIKSSGVAPTGGVKRLSRAEAKKQRETFRAGILQYFKTHKTPVKIAVIRDELDVTDKKEIQLLAQVVAAMVKSKEIDQQGKKTKATYSAHK